MAGMRISRKQTLGEGRGEGRSRRRSQQQAVAWDDDDGCDHGDENGGVRMRARYRNIA